MSSESSVGQPWSRTQIEGLPLAFHKKRDVSPLLSKGRLSTATDGNELAYLVVEAERVPTYILSLKDEPQWG